VTSLETKPHPLFGTSICIQIESDEKLEKFDFVGVEREGWMSLSKKAILDQFRNDGLVEMNQDILALHVKINESMKEKISTLIIELKA